MFHDFVVVTTCCCLYFPPLWMCFLLGFRVFRKFDWTLVLGFSLFSRVVSGPTVFLSVLTFSVVHGTTLDVHGTLSVVWNSEPVVVFSLWFL